MPIPPFSISFAADVNTFLSYVFSDPQTPGKAALRAELKSDWRAALKRHIHFDKKAIDAIDGCSAADAADIESVVLAQVRAHQPVHFGVEFGSGHGHATPSIHAVKAGPAGPAPTAMFSFTIFTINIKCD